MTDDQIQQVAAVLARLDERTERMDRDIRQVIKGQQHHVEMIEKRIDLVHDVAQEANRLATEHRKWATLIMSTVVVALLGAVLTLVGWK